MEDAPRAQGFEPASISYDRQTGSIERTYFGPLCSFCGKDNNAGTSHGVNIWMCIDCDQVWEIKKRPFQGGNKTINTSNQR